MKYTLVWTAEATAAMRKLIQRDGDKVKPFKDAVNALARNPKPSCATQLGSTDVWRLRIGSYRATYEINAGRVHVKVLLVGNTPVS
ncbi:type II toxin-antitoxin system RelE family toxin [Streptomyces endophytica]|uniref:Type II toxin-antitoxin system RelE/ParE family toxin n=1 Tax=Streptomyces endophytica TaxID=2991496 RepID=A0ABY6P8E1_9ACTN|nr:type II toxin-antitoxin system RelE/ParE family toxin [Streptomyces endophytica]UZJ30090.1 type II toxin-antitoxin system RelE/ParE family toxin [Streptomyces endophytica]